MDIWFLQNKERLLLEKQSINSLNDDADWLSCLSWYIDNGLLYLDSIINVDEHQYEVTLIYPCLYPDTPAWIKPKNPKERRWSDHQYGVAGGTLCLEWGQDNWHSGITGADLLTSAYKLLDKEKPHNRENSSEVPSRHLLTIGQDLRGEFCRIYISKNLLEYIRLEECLTTGLIELSLHSQRKSLQIFIKKIIHNDSNSWEDSIIPNGIKARSKGLFYKTNIASDIIKKLNTLKDVEILLVSNGFQKTPLTCKNQIDNLTTILLIDKDLNIHCFVFFGLEDNTKLYPAKPVYSEIDAKNERIPDEDIGLNEKLVGIVGLGSVGSKIAFSLARAGVLSFYLVDDDIFLPENICRNELNWENIGEHKVDAIANELELIDARIKVNVSCLNITEQESSSVLSNTLDKLGNCDIIIDATSNPKVFNVLASISIRYKKPLVWGEVYEGGIGGLIARSRPETDPEPLMMRAAFHNLLSELPKFDSKSAGDYASEDIRGNLISASDADVSIVAYNLTNFVIDTLLRNSQSTYPYSMYFIGLKKSWVFNEPFHIIPVNTNHFIEKVETNPPDSNISDEHKKIILEILENNQNENNTP